ncbi:MAG: hypothetical protein H0V28_13870 [Rubrobacteraceae bacterium]|nr:hypothetical protein [Rubrobacteraceae bacterium]
MTNPGRRAATVVALAAGLALFAGCASAGSEPKAELLRVDIPLREPAWVPEKTAVLALGEDRRSVVRLDVGEDAPGSRPPVRSEEFEDLGENLAVSPGEPGRAYLPRPGSGTISVLNTDTLRVVDDYEVGDSPSYVTLDVQPEVLFALSEDGSKVSSVELETPGKVPAVGVGGGAETIVEAPEKGLDPAFWTSGPGGVAFYGGNPPERMVGERMEATDIAVDLESAQRAYVADGSRVVALEGDPEHFLEGELVAVKARSLGEKVEHVASDELHVFAATQDKLVAMERETLEPAETLDFGPLLKRRGIDPAGVSGMTVGKEDVYLTFEGEPYVLSIKKP